MNEHAGHRSRLRENFIQNGIEGMADHQVLELLLTYALPRVDVNPLAHRLLSRFGSLEGVLSARPDPLRQAEGIGESAAVFLSLLGQVDRRVLLQRFAGHDKRPVLATPSALGRYMLALSLQDRYETLRLVCLNKKYELIYEGVISSGSLTEVLADPRPILETALIHKACFIAHRGRGGGRGHRRGRPVRSGPGRRLQPAHGPGAALFHPRPGHGHDPRGVRPAGLITSSSSDEPAKRTDTQRGWPRPRLRRWR